ncbi:FMN-dependent dehydrogenase-domain-containing protein [Naematelia encephala]|uniref:FMN-dependent dehydrogenase-domain-containing protein n=1 Tax=Naematelia encephala TaxID=71784 RepID=A0A1Y2AWS6_9TREE|nr:FMN-dependent dehydrogenase-domain-containing protein [Naematelia encephala]
MRSRARSELAGMLKQVQLVARPATRRRYASSSTSVPISPRRTSYRYIALGTTVTVIGGVLYNSNLFRVVKLDSSSATQNKKSKTKEEKDGEEKEKAKAKEGEEEKDPKAKDISFKLQTNSVPGPNASQAAGRFISMDEVSTHNLAHDAWVVVDGKVYDVTHFHKHHPGGASIIVSNAGRDVTELFRPIHPPGTLETHLAPENFKGNIDPKQAAEANEAYAAEQSRIDQARNSLPAVETLLSLEELQQAAESFMSPRVKDYYGAAANDGYTMQDNRNSFRKCRLLPRVMRDVSSISPQTTLFGIRSALPIYVSPASNALLGHPEGELNITRGAARTGIIQGVSAASSFSLGDILDERDEMDKELEKDGTKMGMVYQVYVQTDREKTEAQVREAVSRGVQALILTVDTNVLGYRQSTEKIKGTTGDASPGVRMGPITDYPAYHDARQSWGDLPWLKKIANGVPIYLKGVCHIDDVRLAKEHQLAGCILSNHGGRQLDQARTGFDSLRSIHAEDPQLVNDVEIYVDGGVRRGTDVLQAVALGAKGVGLGRPFLWSQAAYGEKGVIRAIRILESEIVMGMRLLGVTKLDQVTPDMVECLQEVWR